MSTPSTKNDRLHTRRDSAVEWTQQFASSVRSRDFEKGATLFAPDVHAFGTRCHEAHGLGDLLLNQWQPTWLRTANFDYLPGSVQVDLSEDASMAVVTARWQSHGVDHQDLWDTQPPYLRSGRCTFVLKCTPNGIWSCIHSHFSMLPDELSPA